MFEFLKPCKKNVPLQQKKTEFQVHHCLTVKKCPEGKTTTATVSIVYDKPVEKYSFGAPWPNTYSEESQSFESSKEIEIYIERLELLVEHLKETKCAMKAEE